MFHLLRSDFYRLKQGLLLKIFLLAAAAFIAALCASAAAAVTGGEFIFFGFAVGASDAAELWRLCVLPAVSPAACLFCPLLTGALFSEERLRNKIVAGFTKRRILFSAFLSCFLPLGILYATASAVCVLSGLLIGFGYGTAFSYAMRFVCGFALLAAYCALFVCLTGLTKKRGVGFVVCVIALIAERFLFKGLTALGALALSSGFGAPFAYLAVMALSLFLPYGSAEMLLVGGSGYPLYLILSAAFSSLCFLIGGAFLQKREVSQPLRGAGRERK